MAELGEDIDAPIWDFGHAHIRLRRRERMGSHGRTATGEGVEQRRLSGVGKPDDAQALHSGQGNGLR